MNSRFQSGV